MAVRFDHHEYFASHYSRARGRGCWMFQFGTGVYNPAECWAAPGYVTFGEAKKAAREEAKRRGETVVRVMP